MKREWQPGDVAMAFDRDWSIRVVRHRGDPDYWSAADGGWPQGVRAEDLQYRPLVVIDPENREQVKRLTDAYLAQFGFAFADHRTDAMQAALRSLITPPRPPEPMGLGAVVVNDQGREFVRMHDGWWRGDEPCSLNWAAVHAVRVLSEGVTE